MARHRRSTRITAKRLAIAAIAAVLSLFAVSSFAAGVTPLISPAAGSDNVLGRLDAEPELRLHYRVERAAAPAEMVTIGLAKDYHYRSSPLGLTVYDYRVRRIFRVSSDSQFINDSLYAEVWYRRAELDNRAAIAAALNKGGIDVGKGLAGQDPFWAEAELGVTTSKFARPNLQRIESKDRIAWRTNDDEVVAVRYRQDAVPEELRPALRRLWPSIAAIHPQVADELAQSGRLPEELWVKQIDRAAKSFENAAGVNANCAPPADSDFCELAARAGPLAKMGSRTPVAFAKQSPDADQRSQFDSLPNGYVLRLLWATRPPGKGVKPQDSELDLLHALQASPVANFCKDIGDFYAGGWQPFAAWQGWDLGRLMAGHTSGDLLDQVDTIEAEVARREPVFF
jgi:hypothetical protein